MLGIEAVQLPLAVSFANSHSTQTNLPENLPQISATLGDSRLSFCEPANRLVVVGLGDIPAIDASLALMGNTHQFGKLNGC